MSSKKKKTTKSSKKGQKAGMLTSVTEAQPLTDGQPPADGQNPPAGDAPKPEEGQPPAPGESGADTAKTPGSPKTAGSSKKKGKKKKLTAKERKRLRLEQQERERLAALQEEQNRLAEKRREEERLLEKQGRERLMSEDQELKTFREMRQSNSSTIRAEAAKTLEWETYLKCDHSTNPLDRADVNSFISIWKEADDTNLKVLFEHIGLATKLIDQIDELRMTAEVSQNQEDLERYSNLIVDLRGLIKQKIELITQHHLMYSDKYYTSNASTTTATELLNAESNGYQYSIWMNIAKNPRIKDIVFTGVSIDICKVIAMYSLAIRITHWPFQSEAGNYALLSPVMECEFIQLPPPPKRVGTYVLRQSNAQTLQMLPYPLKSNNNGAQPPLVFKMKIDPERLPENINNITVIKLDDLENTSTLVSDVQLDLENSIVQFSCITTGVFALAIPKYIHFPFQFWEVNTPVQDTVEIFVRTALTEITITIDKNGLCSMDTPIQFSGLSAAAALTLLQRHGINLIAPDNISDINDTRLHEKPKSLEEVFVSGIADTATGFRIRCSAKNSRLAIGEHEDPRIMFLARQIENYGEPITEDEAIEEEDQIEETAATASVHSEQPPPSATSNGTIQTEQTETKKPERQSKWRCIQGTEKHIFECKNTENQEETDMNMIQGTNFHQHMMPMLMDLASDEVKERVNKASSFIGETVKYLLTKMRVFSVTL